MPARSDWLTGRVDALLAAMAALGLSSSRAAAAELIGERVRWVSSQMRISPASARRYLTDDALAGLAETMAFSIVEETPGADVLAAPRTAAVPLPVLGRGVSGLAEAINIRLHEADDLEHLRETVSQLAHAISAIGLVLADDPAPVVGPPPAVMVPPALLNRAARYLQAAATLVDQGISSPDIGPADAAQLATALTADADLLRRCADA